MLQVTNQAATAAAAAAPQVTTGVLMQGWKALTPQSGCVDSAKRQQQAMPQDSKSKLSQACHQFHRTAEESGVQAAAHVRRAALYLSTIPCAAALVAQDSTPPAQCDETSAARHAGAAPLWHQHSSTQGKHGQTNTLTHA